MSEENRPEELQRISANEIAIRWSNGKQLHYTAAKLRAACPCATCREKRRGEEARKDQQREEVAQGKKRAMSLPVLKPNEAKPLTIERLRPVGNYAYNIAFGDGHDSGLFTLEFLYELGTP